MHAERLLMLSAELEQRDADVARRIAEVAALAERAGAIRARAVEVASQLDTVPAELDLVAHAVLEARAAERGALGELADAEERLATLEGAKRTREEELDRALRTVQDAREVAADAATRVARLDARHVELLEQERKLTDEAETLAASARAVAAEIAGIPRVSDAGRAEPGRTLAELDEWGARTRAALFVVRGTLDAERERIVAEATTLGASVLGEELAGTSVTLVRRRLEEALRQAGGG